MLKNIIGSYFQSNKGIAIYKFNSKKMFFKILYHEIGHFVYRNILSYNLRNKWNTDIHQNNNFITQYASKNTGEDFAETYMFYILHRKILNNKIPDKYNFMYNNVFNKFEPNIRKLK